jgi:hypothetical protein
MTSLKRAVPPPRHLAAFGVAALLVAGCGDAGKGKLNGRQASDLSKQVELAQAAVDAGKCNAAHTAATKGADLASGYGKGVDPKLQDNLVQGFNHLNDTISSDCNKPEKTPTPSPSPTETPTDVPTVVPTITPEPTPSPTPTPTPTPAPTVEETPTSNGLGGAEVTP